MKVYEMLEAMHVVNQLNTALGQNEQCLKIYLNEKSLDESITIYAMSTRDFYERGVHKLKLDRRLVERIAATEYNNELTTISYQGKTYELEVYSGWDWEIEE